MPCQDAHHKARQLHGDTRKLQLDMCYICVGRFAMIFFLTDFWFDSSTFFPFICISSWAASSQ